MINESLAFRKILAEATMVKYQQNLDRFYTWDGKKTFKVYDCYSAKEVEKRNTYFDTDAQGALNFLENWIEEINDISEKHEKVFELKEPLDELDDEWLPDE